MINAPRGGLSALLITRKAAHASLLITTHAPHVSAFDSELPVPDKRTIHGCRLYLLRSSAIAQYSDKIFSGSPGIA
jgi:hypothetical protein